MERMLARLHNAEERRRQGLQGPTDATASTQLAASAEDCELCTELPTPEAVLFVCLHEIGRQVSVTCEDRGRLLFTIRSYVHGDG
jgi:hypothetical protein